MNDRNDHDRDLEIAEKMGQVVTELKSLNEKIDWMKGDSKAIWTEITDTRNKVETHGGVLKWVIGVGVGLNAAFLTFLTYFHSGNGK